MGKRKASLLLAAILLLSVFSIILLYQISKNPQIPYKPPPLISLNEEYLTSRDINLTENTDFILNLTVNSYADKEFTIPFSLELFSIFRDGVQETNPNVSGFDYWFEPSSITIAPSGSNSTILTVKFLSDADIAEYDFRIKTGNSAEHHVGGTMLRIQAYC